jgi:hypothetical protein
MSDTDGAPHGISIAMKDQVNADLLSFIKGRLAAQSSGLARSRNPRNLERISLGKR